MVEHALCFNTILIGELHLEIKIHRHRFSLSIARCTELDEEHENKNDQKTQEKKKIIIKKQHHSSTASFSIPIDRVQRTTCGKVKMNRRFRIKKKEKPNV